MNKEEAITFFKDRIDYLKRYERTDLVPHYEIAIQALEKQIAKKVVPRPGYYLHKCPSCDYRQTTDRDEYCWHCGQKLDWSDAE